MKRIITALFVALFVAFGHNAKASAASCGGEEITSALPDGAADILESAGITPDNSGALGLSFTGTLGAVAGLFRDNIAAPLRMAVSLCGVVLLCAMAEGLADGGLKELYTAVGVLAAAGIAVATVYEVLSDTLLLLSAAADFMLAFIPIFAGFAAFMGYVTSASAVSSAVLAATQLFSQLAVNFLAPICGAVMGLSISGAVHPQLNLTKLAEVVKKFVIWALTLLMTIFMGVLSVQAFVAHSSDGALIRAAKFAVSSGVPIVGGTVAEAVSAISGSISVMKSSIGTYGIIALAVTMLPPLVTVLCCKGSLLLAEGAAEVFGLGELSALFKSCGAVMTIIIAVICCFFLINAVAVIILLMITSGA